jgi:hypothetical protein
MGNYAKEIPVINLDITNTGEGKPIVLMDDRAQSNAI